MRGLPEAEVMRRDLEREYAGRKIKEASATSMQALPRYRQRKQLTDQLAGRKVKAVERRGTLLVFNLEDTDALVFDLGTAGLLLKPKSGRTAAPPGTELELSFGAGGPLRLVDEHGDAEVFVAPLAELHEEVPALARLGFDPLESPVSWQAFGQMLMERGDATLKALLMDPSFVVGVGPVYSDEALFAAGLRYDRAARSLSAQEIRRLYRGLVEVLQEAVKQRGTSLPDEPFRDLYGSPGEFQEHLEVWGRDGLPCPRCRQPIEKVRAAGTVTYVSPSQV